MNEPAPGNHSGRTVVMDDKAWLHHNSLHGQARRRAAVDEKTRCTVSSAEQATQDGEEARNRAYHPQSEARRVHRLAPTKPIRDLVEVLT